MDMHTNSTRRDKVLAGGILALTLIASSSASRGDQAVLECNLRRAHNAPPPDGPVLTSPSIGALTAVTLNAVQFTDKALTRKVLVQDLFARRSETNVVEVIARLVNCTDHALQVDGRTSFMDATQLPVEPTSAWQRVFLPPRATSVYRELSTATNDVAHFLIEIREGR
jgi:hypothetical protein